jgi:PAS domain S-box-containing protein
MAEQTGDSEQQTPRAEYWTKRYFDLAGTMLVVLGTDHRVVRINQQACTVLGSCESDIVGKDWLENFIPERRRSSARLILGRLMAGEGEAVEPTENTIRTLQGQERLIAWHNRVLRNERGVVVGILCSGEDITEHRQTEQQLRDSELWYRQLTEKINEWVWEVDPNGVYTYTSPRVETLLGYAPSEVLGRTPFDLMPPEEAERVRATFLQYVQRRQPFDGLENTNIKKDGQWIVLETSGSPKFDEDGKFIGYRGIDRDITDRKQAEQARRQSEKRLQQLIDAAPYGALEYELCEDHRLVFTGYNRAANRILKVDCHQFVGKTIEQAFPPLAQTAIPAAYCQVAETGVPYEDEQVNYEDDQISGAYEISAFQTAPRRMAVLFRDITERRRAEAKVMDYQNQLRGLVSQLTLSEERERKNLAVELHDGICQSLAIAKLKVDEQLVKPDVDVVQPLLQDLQTTLIGIIEEARSLTNNLGTPMLQQVGLQAALERWLDTEIAAKHGIMIKVVDKGVSKLLHEDTKALLFRAVRELAINVVKHAQAKSLTVILETRSGELFLEITDDGKGFRRTSQSEREVNQGGYGLFSIHERITYIGGSMTVDSAPDKGARILLRVPLDGQLETLDKDVQPN